MSVEALRRHVYHAERDTPQTYGRVAPQTLEERIREQGGVAAVAQAIGLPYKPRQTPQEDRELGDLGDRLEVVTTARIDGHLLINADDVPRDRWTFLAIDRGHPVYEVAGYVRAGAAPEIGVWAKKRPERPCWWIEQSDLLKLKQDRTNGAKCESDHYSPESEDSTSGSSEQDTPSFSNARRTNTDAEFSDGAGQESRALRTFRKLHGANHSDDYETWEETDHARAIAGGGLAQISGASGALVTSSAGDSPAKTSPSPAAARDSQESDRASSSSSPESLTLFSPMEDGCSLRTYPDFFPPTVDEISLSYSRRWPSSGFTTSLGECWTADTSECPSDGAVYSSLPDVLEADVHPRFYLSRKAAAGILRRAERRGKVLPAALRTALSQLAASPPPSDGTERPRTSSPEPSKPQATSAPPRAPTTTPTSPTPSPAKASTPQRTERGEELLSFPSTFSNSNVSRGETGTLTVGSGEEIPSPPAIQSAGMVRRLSPTECERLQGFPDGWTVP